MNTTGTSITNRRYDFDWLRAFGAVMVVVAHCTMVYSPWMASLNRGFFGPVPTSKFLGEFVWNLNLWLMPLFMLLAGASTWFTLRTRSNHQYLRERFLHLGVPFVLLMLIYVVPVTYISRSMLGEFSGSLFEFYQHFFDGIYPAGNFNFFHLWFLLYLLIYTLLTLPLLRLLQRSRGRYLVERLARVCEYRGGLYLFAFPLAAVQVALSGMAPPTVAASVVVNDSARFVEFLLIFIFGFVLLSNPCFHEALQRQWPLALMITLALSTIMFAVAWPDSFDPYRDLPLDYSWQYAVFWTAYALSSWSWLLVWLGLGQRFLTFDHSLLAYGREVSFPLYLLHLPVWAPAVLLITQLPIPALPASIILTVLVLGGTLALIALLKRWQITRALLGMKDEPARPTAIRLRRGDGPLRQHVTLIP